jgi:oligoribonuclease
MTEMRSITPDKILWLDLEMTGLNPEKDRIVEVAAIVTDWQFTELEAFERTIAHDLNEVTALIDANPWYKNYPEHKTEFLEAAIHGTPELEVQQQLLGMINRHFAPDTPALLGGNSIHCDRGFIKYWWPDVEARLHYRMLDVSAWKVVMIGKYNKQFPKKETHRALGDVRESIAELQFYLANK